MRIGLYGMPTAGKTYILRQIDFMKVESGSQLLRKYDPGFDNRSDEEKEKVRRTMASCLLTEKDLIMDGHYAFGDNVVFTEEDGFLYDVILYLYVDPEELQKRMQHSERNAKYLCYDTNAWQMREIEQLRSYCQSNNKDFYVIDNPPTNIFDDVGMILDFIKEIVNGFSCIALSQRCVEEILRKSSTDTITLMDGDKTLIEEDSSYIAYGYKTHLYDNNFYTGFQSWRQSKDFEQFTAIVPEDLSLHYTQRVLNAISQDTFVLSSGSSVVWTRLAKKLGIESFCGREMSAETKLFVVKALQENGKRVIAYGDGMNDYYMLKQANEGYLVSRRDGSISRSLRDMNLEEIIIV